MAWTLVFLLASLQGVAEFLPISSSGHLRIAESVFGLADTPVIFDVMLHLGTLVAVVAVYRTLVGKTVIAAIRGAPRPVEAYRRDPHFRLACHVVLGMLPTFAMVFALRTVAETWSQDIARVGATLLVTAVVLTALGRRVKARKAAPPDAPRPRTLDEMTWKDALVIGLAQGFSATFRGLSRSGSTITTGVFSGLHQEAAASFSFMISIPAVLGALVFSLKGWDGDRTVLLHGLVGAAIAAVVGYLSLRWLLAMLGRGRLYLFAGWCVAVGVFAIAWRLGGFSL